MAASATRPRLQAELQRLYLHGDAALDARQRADLAHSPQSEPAWGLSTADDQTRALVLELAAPADWSALSRVWQGVQTDLGWPAPAIAVSGVDGLQLWFSLVDPVPVAEAHATLRHLAHRWLPAEFAALPEHRVRLYPDAAGRHAPALPVQALDQHDGERWSAFVAPDLAPLFADTPWLDLAPGDDGQSRLLAVLTSIPAAAWRGAQTLMRAEPTVPPSALAAGLHLDLSPAPTDPHPVTTGAASPAGDAAIAAGERDPRRFLLNVMADARVPLALRIEAAKALLSADSD